LELADNVTIQSHARMDAPDNYTSAVTQLRLLVNFALLMNQTATQSQQESHDR
jgi:hypothetical protein